MQGLISALLLGSLAFANVTHSNENTNLTNNGTGLIDLKSNTLLVSDILPSPENVPQSLGSESQIRPPLAATTASDNDAGSSSFVNQQILMTPTANNNNKEQSSIGKIYTYQVPLNGNNKDAPIQDSSPSSSSSVRNSNNGPPPSASLSYQNLGVLDDNVHEDFQYGSSSNPNQPRISKKTSTNLKKKWLSTNNKKTNKKEGTQQQQVSATSYGNATTRQIQGAGSEFLQEYDNNGHVVLLQNHDELQHNHHNHYNNDPHNQQIEINPQEEGGGHIILQPPPIPHHQHIVYNGEHDHGQHHHHHVAGEQHHLLPPHPQSHDDGHIIQLPELPPHHHVHEEHVHPHPPHPHHELSAPKPLKPSIVHRDPHDHYDHHDKIRTQDKDQEHQHPQHHHQEGHHNSYPHLIKKTHGFEPYDYDMHKLPECAHKNKHFYNLTFCLEDHLYPIETILWALHQYGQFAHKMISDVTYQSADNLVTGLTRAEEEGYTYKHYYGANHATHVGLEQYKPPYHGYTYKTDYFKKGGYICPSDIYYGRPKRAMNTYGQWKVIVNVDHVPKKPHYYVHDIDNGIHKKKRSPPYYPHKGHDIPKKGYTQTLRMEQCIYPNAPCSYIDPHFHSKCIQKHNFVRLVAWTLEEGLHVDTFKIPIACSCHIPEPIHFYQEKGHHEERLGNVLPQVNNYLHDQKK